MLKFTKINHFVLNTQVLRQVYMVNSPLVMRLSFEDLKIIHQFFILKNN
jgi:hypothetical protein